MWSPTCVWVAVPQGRTKQWNLTPHPEAQGKLAFLPLRDCTVFEIPCTEYLKGDPNLSYEESKGGCVHGICPVNGDV